MNIYKDKIKKEVEIIVQQNGFHLIELIIRGSQFKPVFEVFIDSEKGVTANDCAEISKIIASFLDSPDFNFKDYRLDVSSPGVDKPLKFLWQYPKNIGRFFELTITVDEIKRSLKAKLISVDGETLFFEENKMNLELNYNQIESAKVLISF